MSQSTTGGNETDFDDDVSMDGSQLTTSKRKKASTYRGDNWQPAATNKLAELCAENWETLTGELDTAGRKSKSGITADSRAECWATITDKVNSVATCRRTVEQMKRKFGKIKSEGNLCAVLFWFISIELQKNGFIF